MSRNNELLKRWRDGDSAPTWKPQSRIEKILFKILGADVATEKPQSRAEELLLEISEQGGGGKPEAITITENGTYEKENGYSPVTVDVQATAADTLGELLAGTLGDYTNDSITELNGGAFQGVISRGTLHFPALTHIGSSRAGQGGNTFNYYPGDIDVPNLTTIDGAFNFSRSGISKAKWNIGSTTIGNFAFSHADSLTMADITFTRAGTTVGFGSSAFESCGNLEHVRIATTSEKTTPNIDSNCFKACAKLVALVIESTLGCGLYNVNAFTGTPIASGSGYIYVPDDKVDTYKAATNWAVYADQIKPISELPAKYKEA